MATIELGPEHGRLLIRTGRSGLGRRAGHDLLIEATNWSGTLTLDGDSLDDSSAEGSSVRVTIPVDGLDVREGIGGVLPISVQDTGEILKNLRNVLGADQYPEITYASTGIEGTPAEFSVNGELTIMGRSEPLSLRAVRSEDGQVRGEATVKQTRWGIKPYSAFFGALKLADEIGVEFELRL